jgi:hypothetical protein
MEKTIKEHVAYIRREIESIAGEIKVTKDPLVAHHLSADIRALKLALVHYDLALQIEQEVADERAKRSA